MISKLIEKCPVCGGKVVEKEFEKVLEGGSNTANVKVKAELCLHCGERLCSPETVSRFDKIRKKLTSDDEGDFEPGGKTYQLD